MQLFESLFLGCLLFLLVAIQKPAWQAAGEILLLAALALALLNGIFETWRWPLLPAYAGFALLAWFVATNGKAHAVPGLWLTVGAAVPACLSLLLLAGLPLIRAPAPGGTYPVGVIAFFVEDPARAESIQGNESAPRALYVKAWYPGAAAQATLGYERSGLWEEIATEPQFKPLRAILGFLTSTKMHSLRQLPPADGRFPVLIYNHAIVSYPSENSLLLEELASHGYVVFSVSHVRQLDAFRKLPPGSNSETAAVLDSIRLAANGAEKAALGHAYYEAATATNALVESRMLDSLLVLDTLRERAPAGIVRAIAASADFDRVGALGHSLGGSVSTELCKASSVCRAAANLDGGGFGIRHAQALRVPYLMLSSEVASDMNEFQRLQANNAYYDYTFRHTRHGGFSDQGTFLPLYRWLGLLGRADAGEVLAWKKRLVLAFFEHTLKGAPEAPPAAPPTAMIHARIGAARAE